MLKWAMNLMNAKFLKKKIFSLVGFAGYKQFTWWVHNHLGFGVRKVIPSCAVWAIRETYQDRVANILPSWNIKKRGRLVTEEEIAEAD